MAERLNRRHDDASIGKGIVAGAIGGFVASYLMNEFMALWARTANTRESDRVTTEALTQEMARRTIDRPFTRDELAVAAPIVHYGYGAATGALYGILSEFAPTNAFAGAAWGTLIWILADEVVMPALGLAEPPRHRWSEARTQAFASHVVYGGATDIVSRAVRSKL